MPEDDRAGKTSMYDTLQAWARRTTTSFTGLRAPGFDRDHGPASAAGGSGNELIYRLRRWPELAPRHKTVPILRTLSVMSSQPVNRKWILSTSGLPGREVDALIRRLEADGSLEVIDPSRFRSS